MQGLDKEGLALHAAGLHLGQKADRITDSIVADLVQQCSQVLKQLQGIMVTYRCVFHTRVMPPGKSLHISAWLIPPPWQLNLAMT